MVVENEIIINLKLFVLTEFSIQKEFDQLLLLNKFDTEAYGVPFSRQIWLANLQKTAECVEMGAV